MPPLGLEPFNLAIRPRGRCRLEVQVLYAGGNKNPSERFVVPWSPPEVADLMAAIEQQIQYARQRSSAEGALSSAAPVPAIDLRDLGGKLFNSLFPGTIGRLLDERLDYLAAGDGAISARGLRFRIFVAPGLADVAALPWEILFHPRRRMFLARAPHALSRCLPVEPPMVGRGRPPLKIVLVGPAPSELSALELPAERERLRRGLQDYRAVEVLEKVPTTLDQLVEVLAEDPQVHVLHFMGHGGFDSVSGHGALFFEGPDQKRHPVTGQLLAEQLRACPNLRLAVLNSCQSGRLPWRRGQDPFTGVASALLWNGLSAVVAMQFAVSDQAAIDFCGKLYSALAHGLPVDVATVHGRMALHRHTPDSLEWLTPVLFLQEADGQIFALETPPAGAPEPRLDPEPEWMATLAERFAEAGEEGSYLDGSLRRVRRRLEQLDRLFVLAGVLSREEVEVLRATAHLRWLAGADGFAEWAGKLGRELGWSGELAAAAGRAAAAAGEKADLREASLHTGAWRLDLIAALLRLSELLDLDRRAVRPALAQRMPEAEADLSAWLAHLTREVRTGRGGIVKFVLAAPSSEWIEPLKRATALRLEAAWQGLRTVLAPAGLVVAAAPSEIVLEASGEPPAPVLDRLWQLARDVGAALPCLDHLGAAPAAFDLDRLLPLPGSAVTGEETLAYGESFPALLKVVDEESGREIYRRAVAAGEPELILDVGDLRPDHWYRWWLFSTQLAGRLRLIRLGRLRPLGPRERQHLDALGGESSRAALLAHGLHDQFLRELTPALHAGSATLEEIALAHRLIVGAYEWVLAEDWDCPQVEIYRVAAIWLQGQMSPGGPKP